MEKGEILGLNSMIYQLNKIKYIVHVILAAVVAGILIMAIQQVMKEYNYINLWFVLGLQIVYLIHYLWMWASYSNAIFGGNIGKNEEEKIHITWLYVKQGLKQLYVFHTYCLMFQILYWSVWSRNIESAIYILQIFLMQSI